MARRSASVLGRGGKGDRLDTAAAADFRRKRRRVRPLVPRRDVQHLFQRARPPRRARARRSDGDFLRQPGHCDETPHHLRRTARRNGDAGGGAGRSRGRQGRPGHHLHADDSRGDRGDAGLRAHRRDPFGGFRRLRRQGARHPHRRRGAQAGAHRELRRRAGAARRIQAPARPRHRPVEEQAAILRRLPAAAARGQDDARARPRLGGAHRGARAPRASARPASKSPPPIRSISSTPRERPASPRAWCATTAATSSRWNGR